MRFRLALVLTFSLAGISLLAQTPAAKPKAIDPTDFDTSARPCVDFYQYANGAWLSAHPIPADRSRYGSFDALSDRNRDVVKKILEETSAKTDWPKGSPGQKVSDFYATGMDEAAREKAGAAPLAPVFAAIARLKAADDLPAVLAELHLSGVPGGLQLPRRAGRARLHALHRNLQPGRPRPARPRLLPQGGREVEGPARGVSRPRREDARARGRHAGRRRPRRTGSSRSRRSSPARRSPASRTATRRRPTTRGRSRP